MTFYKGQHVVCIRVGGWHWHPSTNWVIRLFRPADGPVKGDVLVVEDVGTDFEGEVRLAFSEWGEAWFRACQFRPVVFPRASKSTEASFKLLDDIRKQASKTKETHS